MLSSLKVMENCLLLIEKRLFLIRLSAVFRRVFERLKWTEIDAVDPPVEYRLPEFIVIEFPVEVEHFRLGSLLILVEKVFCRSRFSFLRKLILKFILRPRNQMDYLRWSSKNIWILDSHPELLRKARRKFGNLMK